MRLISLLPVSLLLAACGGTTTPVTIASSGYAQAGQTIDDVETFTLRGADAVFTTTSLAEFRKAEIKIGSPKEDDSIDITIEGVVYNLGLLEDGSYEGTVGDEVTRIRTILDVSPVAQSILMSWGNRDSNEFFVAKLVVGLETDPETILQQSNVATFSGAIVTTLSQRDSYGAVGGLMTLDVDFTEASVSGSFEVNEFEGSYFQVLTSDAVFILEESAITKTGFSGDITLESGDIGATLQDATYNGTFFGAEGETAGGTFTATLDDPSDTQDILANGAFIANKDDE